MYIHSCLVLHICTISSSPAASAIMLLLCSVSSHQTLTNSVVAEVEVQSSGTSQSSLTTSVSYVFPVTVHTHTQPSSCLLFLVYSMHIDVRLIMSVLEVFTNCVCTYLLPHVPPPHSYRVLSPPVHCPSWFQSS